MRKTAGRKPRGGEAASSPPLLPPLDSGPPAAPKRLAMWTIDRERPGDEEAIEVLLDAAFSPARRQLTAYRFRDGVPPLDALSFVLRGAGDELLGTIRFWPVLLEGGHLSERALLLGPIAVSPRIRGNGAGLALIAHGLAAARAAQVARHVFLIGDLPYYARAGFRPTLPARAELPGPFAPERLLHQPLVADAPELPAFFALRPLAGPA